MFETSVQMVLTAEHDYVREVGIVDMRIHSEKSFKYHFDYLSEVFWETDAYKIECNIY